MCPEQPETSKMESFATTVTNRKLLTIAAKCFILDFCRSPGYVSEGNTSFFMQCRNKCTYKQIDNN